MKKFLFLLLLIASSNSIAGKNQDLIVSTIETLGLKIEQFSDIWKMYCKPYWKSIYFENLLETSEFAKNAHKSGFINAVYENEVTKLSPGTKCYALLDYYLDDKQATNIANFIEKDKVIIGMFGFSSLDLYKTSASYFESYNTYNWSKDKLLHLDKILERHRRKKIFNIETKNSTKGYVKENGEIKEIKVKPYKVYYLTPSEELKNAHKKINSEYVD